MAEATRVRAAVKSMTYETRRLASADTDAI
jgi:hypothetical protein